MAHASAVFAGVALGLAIGKPMGIALTAWIAAKVRIATLPADIAPSVLLGAALLCGIGDPLSLLMAEEAFHNDAYASIAKIGILAGSVLAAVLGAAVLSVSRAPGTVQTEAEARPAADA